MFVAPFAILVLEIAAPGQQTASSTAATIIERVQRSYANEKYDAGLLGELARAKRHTTDPRQLAEILLLEAVYYSFEPHDWRALELTLEASMLNPDAELCCRKESLQPFLDCTKKHVRWLLEYLRADISAIRSEVALNATVFRNATLVEPFACPAVDPRWIVHLKPTIPAEKREAPEPSLDFDAVVMVAYRYMIRPVADQGAHFGSFEPGVEVGLGGPFFVSARGIVGRSNTADHRYLFGTFFQIYYFPVEIFGVGVTTYFAATANDAVRHINGGWAGIGGTIRLVPFMTTADWRSGLAVEASLTAILAYESFLDEPDEAQAAISPLTCVAVGYLF